MARKRQLRHSGEFKFAQILINLMHFVHLSLAGEEEEEEALATGGDHLGTSREVRVFLHRRLI